MANEREEMLEKSATLYFGPWYRKSPIFEATRRAGCTAYDIYNHMYLPGYYDDPEVEYYALNNDVTLWDVGVERTVEVSGPDADRADRHDHVPRPDEVRGRPGQVHARHRARRQHRERPGAAARRDRTCGGCNSRTPTPACTRSACSPTPAWTRGDAARRPPGAGAGTEGRQDAPEARRGRDLRSEVLLVRLVRDPRHPRRDQPDRLDGDPRVRGEPARLQPRRCPLGRDPRRRRGVRHPPIAPCEARRIEAGIFNYGSDITLGDTPFHVMGLERLVEEQPQDYIGKDALERSVARASTASSSASSWTATSCVPRCPRTGRCARTA